MAAGGEKLEEVGKLSETFEKLEVKDKVFDEAPSNPLIVYVPVSFGGKTFAFVESSCPLVFPFGVLEEAKQKVINVLF